MGSEMCIRDRVFNELHFPGHKQRHNLADQKDKHQSNNQDDAYAAETNTKGSDFIFVLTPVAVSVIFCGFH